MPLRRVNFEDIAEAHLSQLISNGVSEGPEFDYKRDVIGGSDDAKREFLKDVSSFANASGGHLIIGMDEEKGVPTALPGLRGVDSDAEIQRLESITRDSLEPRIIGIRMKAVALSSGSPAIVIRVPRSWNPPHRVNFKGWNKFFTRNSAGAHEVNVEELRSLFTAGASLAERVRSFRIDRLAKIIANDTPLLIKGDGRCVLHVIPLITLGDQSAVDLIKAASLERLFPPIRSRGHSRHVNFDGLLFSSGQFPDGQYDAYTQLFRDGCVETACGDFAFSNPGRPRGLPSEMDDYMFTVLPSYISGLSALGIDPPYAVMISILGMKNSVIVLTGSYVSTKQLDRDDLIVPPVTLQVDRLEGDWHHLMRPAIDAIWNAYGYFAATNYDKDGKWQPR